MVDDFRKYFVDISFEQISRNDNKATDVVATIAYLLQIQENQDRYKYLMKELSHHSYDCLDSQIICHLVGPDSSHYGQICTYLKDGTVPLDLSKNQKQNFIRQSAHYTIVTNTLYRRGLDGTLLEYL